jgi:Rhodopirellula transposase DDE domain
VTGSEVDGAVLAGKFAVMRRLLDERQWRLYLGTEAQALGRGGIAAVARASGASETTVAAGLREAADEAALAVLEPGRARRPGAGRPKAEKADLGLALALKGLLEPTVRGDPVTAVTWTTLSLRDLERELAALGHPVRKDAIARLLHEDGYSLQGASRVLEGSQHPDRDPQFRHINDLIAAFTAAGDPVFSVDAKKKEQLGPFWRAGRAWRLAGDPVKVRDHDFPDPALGKITPYGIYDIAANRGFVSVGTSHDTAAFAVNAMRLQWRAEGAARYPGARRLLITCDAGGSNGYRSRLFKDELARFAAEAGLEITVCHFPPGTSKWNKIEHRLFCHITRTWRGTPLMTAQDAVAGIAATTTYAGLKVTAVLDDAPYPEGTEVSGKRMKHLRDQVLDPDPFHGEWNYTVRAVPHPRPGPEPEPGPEPAGPGPEIPAALAAAAGIRDFGALLADIDVAWQADREHRLTLDRGHARRRAPGSGTAGPRKLAPGALIAAAACRIRLGMTWALLAEILSVHCTSISVPAGPAIPILQAHGITAEPGTPRITTINAFRDHAAALGITINGITSQPTQPRTTTTRPAPAS